MDIRSLGYVFIEATDPQKWLEFGTEVVGLMPSPVMPDDGNVYLKMDERPFRFAITKGETDRLCFGGWELLDQENYTQALKELDDAGVAYEHGTEEEAQLRQVKAFVKLKDPAGNSLELYWGASLDYSKFVSPVGIDAFETGFNGDMGFGHMVLQAINLEETYEFYKNVLGLGDVDRMHFHFNPDPADPGQGLRFMHCNNPRHHSLALYQAEGMPGDCVHLMVEVKNNIDEVGYALDRVNEREIPVVSTLGRHTNDQMISFYMATPAGFALEFGTDGLQMDWEDYTPTVSTLPSFWGHKFGG